MSLWILFLLCNSPGNALRMSSQPSTSRNATSSQHSTPDLPANRLSIRCDSHYGLQLDVLDCWNAIRQIESGDIFITFEPRETMQPGDLKLPLPFRTMGSKSFSCHFSSSLPKTAELNHSTDSGHCYVQPELRDFTTSGTISLNQIKSAASQIVTECSLSPGTGGIAINAGSLASSKKNIFRMRNPLIYVGGDNNIAITVGKYHPSVVCRGILPRWPSCVYITFGMEADREEKVFGPLSVPGVDVGLPATLTGGRHSGHRLQDS